jgi:hypothetical protein
VGECNRRLDRSRNVPSAVASGLGQGLDGGVTCIAMGAAWGAIFPTERWQGAQLAPAVAARRVDGLRIARRGRF